MVTLERIAKEKAHVLRNLFELYAHDFSETVPMDLDEEGRFGVAIDPSSFPGQDGVRRAFVNRPIDAGK